MNYRGVLLNLIVILKKRGGREEWGVRDTEETERKEEERDKEIGREKVWEKSGALIVYSVDGVNQWIIGVRRSLAGEYHLFGNELFA